MKQAIVTEDMALVSDAVVQAADWLGLKRKQLADAIGVSESVIARMRSGSGSLPNKKSYELALLLIRCYRALYAIVGGDKASIRHWVNTPNTHLQNAVPAELMTEVSGLVQVLRYLDAMRGRH